MHSLTFKVEGCCKQKVLSCTSAKSCSVASSNNSEAWAIKWAWASSDIMPFRPSNSALQPAQLKGKRQDNSRCQDLSSPWDNWEGFSLFYQKFIAQPSDRPHINLARLFISCVWACSLTTQRLLQFTVGVWSDTHVTQPWKCSSTLPKGWWQDLYTWFKEMILVMDTSALLAACLPEDGKVLPPSHVSGLASFARLQTDREACVYQIWTIAIH